MKALAQTENSNKLRSRGVAPLTAIVLVFALLMAACSNSNDSSTEVGAQTPTSAASQSTSGETPVVLVSTGIWSSVVSSLLCNGEANVETIIPVGSDPHSYEPSLRDRERMENASLVVVNGLNLEERLFDTLEAAEGAGASVLRVGDHVDVLSYEDGGHAHDHAEEAPAEEAPAEDAHDHDHAEETPAEEAPAEDAHDHDHAEEAPAEEAPAEDAHDHDHAEETPAEETPAEDAHAHDHSGADPHIWFDPHRVEQAAVAIQQRLVSSGVVDAASSETCLNEFSNALDALDAEIASQVEQVPQANRKLVTNHDALRYFANRYGFEVIGAVIPSPSTMAETNPAQLAALAEIIEHEGVPAIFAETQHSSNDAEALANEVGDVAVVTLYTGSLGPAGSGAEDYLGFMRTNTNLIVDALS